MYPVLFRIGSFEITSFGVLVAIGALAGIWVFQRELARRSLPESGVDAGIAGVLGGLLGAKLLWTIEHAGEEPLTGLLFSRGGMSWFGGLIGGVVAGIWMLRRRGVPLLAGLAAASPGLALGHGVGRIGCFLVGDDYGRPTDLPWGVAFPQGLPPTDIPVHPTQLYELALLLPVTWLLIRWRRAGVSDRVVFGRYLLLAGVIRFAIEFVRVNEPVAGPLTLAHLISVAVALAGVALLAAAGRAGEPPGARIAGAASSSRARPPR
jgi:phosphatidylglycerol:prolipoprotein diacylglycerol transferase